MLEPHGKLYLVGASSASMNGEPGRHGAIDLDAHQRLHRVD